VTRNYEFCYYGLRLWITQVRKSLENILPKMALMITLQHKICPVEQ